MPIAIRAVVAFNIVASIVVIVAAYSLGGGFTADPFPPEREIVLDPVETPPMPLHAVASSASRHAFTIPQEFDRLEPVAPRWETRSDGTVRILD